LSATFAAIRDLVRQGKILISKHGLARLAKRGILARVVAAGVDAGEAIEDYPNFHKGPSVLVLQSDGAGGHLHALWGIGKGTTEPAVLITAYRPNPAEWSSDYRTRKP
jgi:hypothetical protein